jgi:hypothetical protein
MGFRRPPRAVIGAGRATSRAVMGAPQSHPPGSTQRQPAPPVGGYGYIRLGPSLGLMGSTESWRTSSEMKGLQSGPVHSRNMRLMSLEALPRRRKRARP